MKKVTFLGFLIVFINYSCIAQLQSLTNIKTWAYQLQGIDISQVAGDTTFKMIIMDYSSDGTDEYKYTPQEISHIKASGKKTISYISIGEAEDYRYYWQSSWNTTPPAWLGPENPDWAGNYKVKFWDQQWQNIIFAYVDTIISQGFDGIYMDIIDGYYYWMVENPQKTYSDTLMMQFVKNIRNHIDSVTGNSDFIMIPQNAEDIINSDNITPAQKSAYFGAVNGVGVEDVFCPGDLDENNPYNPDTYRIGQLQEWMSNNKQVFSVEYLTQSPLIAQYIVGAQSYDFVPYVCTRALDQLCSGIPEGLKEIRHDETFGIFPNPSSGIISVKGNMPENKCEIFVYSPAGCMVKKYGMNELNNSGTDLYINMSAFPDGVYFLKIRTGNSVEHQKVIISH